MINLNTVYKTPFPACRQPKTWTFAKISSCLLRGKKTDFSSLLQNDYWNKLFHATPDQHPCSSPASSFFDLPVMPPLLFLNNFQIFPVDVILVEGCMLCHSRSTTHEGQTFWQVNCGRACDLPFNPPPLLKNMSIRVCAGVFQSIGKLKGFENRSHLLHSSDERHELHFLNLTQDFENEKAGESKTKNRSEKRDKLRLLSSNISWFMKPNLQPRFTQSITASKRQTGFALSYCN